MQVAEDPSKRPVVIIGAGPAGLTAAYELSKHGRTAVILESDQVVGGIARTVNYKGYLFDIGGHRFFTKVQLVDKIWREILPNDFLRRPRLSRIFYGKLFYWYPLKVGNVLSNLGLWESGMCVLSYVWARIAPIQPETNFESWVVNRFGRRLFNKFFKSYTEKVWGMPCSEIQAEWAAQRIRGLSFVSAAVNAIKGAFATQKEQQIKTLINEFDYPRRGPGMMWEKATEILAQRGSPVHFGEKVTKIKWETGRVISITAGGQEYSGDHFISSMPIRDLIKALDPAPPDWLRDAAKDFSYRDFLTVALVIKNPELFPDNWIYIHEPGVKVGRIQNFGNWSPEMIPDPTTSCLGLEYFCFEGDGLWSMSDEELIKLGTQEVAQLGLVKASEVIDGTIVRMPKAYPVYDSAYKNGVAAIQRFLKEVPNLQLVGRNGMHYYNNQDHSMLTAVMAARNICGSRYDLWQVNTGLEYHEEGGDITEEDVLRMAQSQPAVPGAVKAS